MSYSISVDNIKCGGCASTIRTRLNEMDIVDDCQVDIDNGIVNIDGDQADRRQVADKLLSLGYPESGTAEGLGAATAKAKSFVSCAVGRMNK